MIASLDDRFRHPWIVLMLGITAGFLILSVVTGATVDNKFVSGFLAVYAVLSFTIAVFAFLASQFIRLVSTRRSSEFNQ